MLKVICVKTGTRYGAEYVNRLHKATRKHLHMPFDFWCITDNPDGIKGLGETVFYLDTSSLGLDYPWGPDGLEGWWNKLYLFSTGHLDPGPLLYLDLDQILLGDITPLVEEGLKHPFACYRDHIDWMGSQLGSAWMQFNYGAFPHIWDHFQQNYEQVRHLPAGDQCYLAEHIESPTYLNEYFPGALLSYKFDLNGKQPPPEARLINFHGRPKPHEADDYFILSNWKGLDLEKTED